MKKLFYRLSSRRPFARLFSMHARLEVRRRVIFPKSSVFAVVALAAFVSLGALLLPQIGEAQEECIWNCDLGSDFFNFPGENSPGFSIVYCFDQPCVAGLGIFTDPIPTASVQQSVVGELTCDGTPSNTIRISGNVIAVLKDKKGVHSASAAEASLFIEVLNVKCDPSSDLLTSDLLREVSVPYSPSDV